MNGSGSCAAGRPNPQHYETIRSHSTAVSFQSVNIATTRARRGLPSPSSLRRGPPRSRLVQLLPKPPLSDVADAGAQPPGSDAHPANRRRFPLSLWSLLFRGNSPGSAHEARNTDRIQSASRAPKVAAFKMQPRPFQSPPFQRTAGLPAVCELLQTRIRSSRHLFQESRAAPRDGSRNPGPDPVQPAKQQLDKTYN
jgi:hypothetical protein